VVLMDASKLGTTIKVGKNQKTVLNDEEENRIITTFNNKQAVEDFSVVVSYDDIKSKNYSLSAGQYFDVKIEYVDITKEEFEAKLKDFENKLNVLFNTSNDLEIEIKKNLNGLLNA
ncbi:MAG: SAM-dependent DNA methyltransferase, partial [Ignavibacteriaceae bacterium]|nr:SAM-dependent DNA methyltransferase [Ignavibacteriaceae bacterium]